MHSRRGSDACGGRGRQLLTMDSGSAGGDHPGMRRRLPSATVTFLFTDVEGSTRLLHELGAEAYAEALAEHRRVLRAVFAAEGGVEVDTQGDAFFYAFADARAAVAAAADGECGARARPDPDPNGAAHRRAASDGGGLRRRGRPSRCADRGRGPRWAGAAVGGDAGVAGRRRDRPRRASAEGLRRAGGDLPARRGALPAPQDDLQHEPAAAGVLVRRA